MDSAHDSQNITLPMAVVRRIMHRSQEELNDAPANFWRPSEVEGPGFTDDVLLPLALGVVHRQSHRLFRLPESVDQPAPLS